MKKAIIPNLLGRIQSVEIQEGETIETKVARITQNKELRIGKGKAYGIELMVKKKIALS